MRTRRTMKDKKIKFESISSIKLSKKLFIIKNYKNNFKSSKSYLLSKFLKGV